MHRLILSVTLTLALATSAAAKEPAEKAFDLLSRYTAEKTAQDYIKLQNSIPAKDAEKLDAKLSTLYGEPKVTRAGLKVWEVQNPAPSAQQAKFTTIMCGPDGKGGYYISADSRGSNADVALRAKQRKKAKSASRPAPQAQSRRMQPLTTQRTIQSNEVD